MDLHVLRVFVGADGRYGNPLGVFVDGLAVHLRDRQRMARELNYSETVFVDHVADGAARIQIYTPGTQLGFAGHPTVGTSWLLRNLGNAVDTLEVPAGEVPVWQDADLAWIRAHAAWVHPMTIHEYASGAEVDALSGPPAGEGSFYAWAWLDEANGVLRSRYFAGGLGVAEDEATGAAAVVMGDQLSRPLLIRQGRGSELHVRPGPDGTVEVGGRVALETVRSIGG
jgi:predicted PhzF superfamily epimerase YddE/YHI9